VACEGNACLLPVDLASGTAGPGAHVVAVDPVTHLVYLPLEDLGVGQSCASSHRSARDPLAGPATRATSPATWRRGGCGLPAAVRDGQQLCRRQAPEAERLHRSAFRPEIPVADDGTERDDRLRHGRRLPELARERSDWDQAVWHVLAEVAVGERAGRGRAPALTPRL